MRSTILENQAFLQGAIAGLALAGVAIVTYEAGRRVLRSRENRLRTADRALIDGARPINPIDLDLQQPPETRSTARRLESEGPDAAHVSQRW